MTLPAGGGCPAALFETEIANQGAHGYIAVGWCRMTYPQRCRQPGAPLVRIPRRRRPRLQRLRLRQALRPTFGTEVVGSGIVEVHGDSYEGRARTSSTPSTARSSARRSRSAAAGAAPPCAAPAQKSPSAATSRRAISARPTPLPLPRQVRGLHSPGESVRLHRRQRRGLSRERSACAAGAVRLRPERLIASLTPHPPVPPAPRAVEPTERRRHRNLAAASRRPRPRRRRRRPRARARATLWTTTRARTRTRAPTARLRAPGWRRRCRNCSRITTRRTTRRRRWPRCFYSTAPAPGAQPARELGRVEHQRPTATRLRHLCALVLQHE